MAIWVSSSGYELALGHKRGGWGGWGVWVTVVGETGHTCLFRILGLWVYVSAGSAGMVRGSRAVGVSWDMGMAQGLRVGVWEGSEMVYCTTA